MPTLQNINGASLTPDASPGLNVLLQAFGTPESRAANARKAELENLRLGGIKEALGSIDGEASAGGTPGSAVSGEVSEDSAPSKRQSKALERLAIVAPQAATAVRNIQVSQNAEARETFRLEAEKGVRNAEFVSKQTDFAGKQRAIRKLAAEAARNGQPLDRFIELQNMSEPELDLELQRMKIAGKDIKSILGPKFETVKNEAGEVVAQRNTETGQRSADPEAVLKAKVAAAKSKGLFSAKTKILADGSTVQAGPSGKVVVRGPNGEVVEGAERLQVLKGAQQAELDQARAGAASEAAGKQAIKKSGEAIDSLAKVKTSIANIDEAIRLIDEGAQTGTVMSRLPSVRASSIELDNVQKRMGLDVVGETTFGALSKGELDLALSAALPTRLQPEALKEWLVEKKAAQEKLAGYLESAAIFLGIPGNTAADWIEQQKELREQEGATPATVDIGGQTVEVGAVITNNAGQRGRVEADGTITVLP